MPLRRLLLVFALVPAVALSQPAPLPSNPVAPTPAETRLDGYAQRQALLERSLVGNVPFRSVGPTVMSGRVADLEASPADPATFYVAYASGGLWKTTSNGTAFTPLFDTLAVMTLGDVAVDWRDPEGDGETVWAGTGENNSSRSSYSGTGLYRSTDGGQTWMHRGLSDTHHIGRIALHATDPNTVWVGAIGHLYSPNRERGVFKTTDGGETWRQTLFVDEDTGVIDLVADPSNPDVLYAATWTRTRRAWDFSEAGAGSAIYKSEDGGETWVRVTVEGSGFPTGEEVGRIGLAVYPGDPRIVYAVVDNQARRPEEPDEEEPVVTRDLLRTMGREAFVALADEALDDFLDRNDFPASYTAQSLKEMVQNGQITPLALVEYLEDANTMLFDTPVIGAEVYRSDDGGRSWRRTHGDFLDDLFYSYGYYFGQIRVAPNDPDRVYVLGVPLIASSDGGATWESIDDDHVHVDHHALFVSPSRPGHLVNGNDGGVNVSFDDGASWFKANVPAVGQCYTIAVDEADPYRVYCGMQDNGVWAGPSTYAAGRGWTASGEYAFESIMGGDGMQVQVDTRTNRTVYTGFQFGNYFRVERDGPPAERITPRHDLGERPLRFNWQSPIHLSRHNQDILYLGSHRVHRSLDRGATWNVISPDLTHGGRRGDVPYGTLTTLQESPFRFGQLAVGSDDGRVHVTVDGGYTWNDVSNGLPADLWVSRVEWSHHAPERLYVSLNGYRWDHFDAYVFRSDDLGATWRRIGQDLPQEPVNVVREDPANPDLLYVGTDHGVYISLDRGETFMAMMGQTSAEGALPHAAAHDLTVQAREKDLVVGTHGRSIWIADVRYVQALTPALRAEGLRLFTPDTLTHSTGWGDRGWRWSEPDEPRVDLVFYTDQAGPAELVVTDERRRTVQRLTDDAEAGLNYVAYDLATDVPMDDDHEPSELTGKRYLRPGAYTVTLRQGGRTSTAALVVNEAPPPRSRRRRTP